MNFYQYSLLMICSCSISRAVFSSTTRTMPTYPGGPTSCESDPGCTPRIDDPEDAGPVVIYCFWAFLAVFFVMFFIYKRLSLARYHQANGKLRHSMATTESHSIEPSGIALEEVTTSPAGKEDVTTRLSPRGQTSKGGPDERLERTDDDEQQEGPKLAMLGYKENFFGQICTVLTGLLSLSWIVIFLVIMIDGYNNCEFKSIDDACFYGDYFIFGDYETNSKYMFVVWCLCLPWYVFIIEKGGRLRNWFRMPVTLEEAELVLVTSTSNSECMVVNPGKLLQMWQALLSKFYSNEVVYSETVPVVHTTDGLRYFEFQCKRFVYAGGTFEQAKVVVGPTLQAIHEGAIKGLTRQQWQQRIDRIGPNKIPFSVSPMATLLVEELFSYFYLYQLVMYVVWFWFSYLIVATVLFTVVCISAGANIWIKRSHQVTIASMTAHHMQIRVCRDGEWEMVDSTDLVPGDTVRVQSNTLAPCDMALVHGSAVCDESGLTGESMPVGKSVLLKNSKLYDSGTNKSSTLFGGTTVLQAGSESAGASEEDSLPIAVVTATGINADKGQLISQILHPTPMAFKYDEELPLVVTMLLMYALVCFILSLVLQSNSGASSIWTTKWAYGIFTVSQIVSPLLPIALVVGQTMSSKRLADVGVCCLDPKRIAISGKVRVACFDKTGTLTKEGLDFLGVHESEALAAGGFGFRDLVQVDSLEPNGVLPMGQQVENALAVCHNVKTMGDTLVGNQVEVKMFSYCQDNCGFNLVQDSAGASRSVLNSAKNIQLQICKTFEFDHGRMTMTVLVRDCNTQEVTVFCKGSYERIGELCGKSNSRPEDFDPVSKGHATCGCYVLGMSSRAVGKLSDAEIQAMTRDEAEMSGPLTLIGLILFRNELKPDSASAMRAIKAGDVRNVMLTGDNAQCGCYIARKCGMVEPGKLVLFGDDPAKSGTVTWTQMGGGETEHSPAEVAKYTQMLIDVYTKESGQDEMFGQIELAMTQKALDTLTAADQIKHLLLHCRIYARLRPDGKVAVVNLLAARGLIVSMTGDGGNDCGALRVAHAGIALSEAEASVVSPFTSKTKSIQSVVDLLKEGRSALATSFASYKFLIMYGQLFSVLKLICFYYGVIMCMMDYIMIDGIAVLVVSYVMTLSKPEPVLPNQRPTSSLLGTTTVCSVVGQQTINVSFLFSALAVMRNDSDYIKWPASSVANSGAWWLLGDNWETTVIFCVVYSQFLTSGMLYTFGSHWREAVWKNWGMTVFWILAFAFTSFLLLSDNNSCTDVFHIANRDFGGGNSPVWDAAGQVQKGMSSALRWKIWSLAVASMICTAVWEKFVILGPVRDWLQKKTLDSKPGVVLRL